MNRGCSTIRYIQTQTAAQLVHICRPSGEAKRAAADARVFSSFAHPEAEHVSRPESVASNAPPGAPLEPSDDLDEQPCCSLPGPGISDLVQEIRNAAAWQDLEAVALQHAYLITPGLAARLLVRTAQLAGTLRPAQASTDGVGQLCRERGAPNASSAGSLGQVQGTSAVEGGSQAGGTSTADVGRVADAARVEGQVLITSTAKDEGRLECMSTAELDGQGGSVIAAHHEDVAPCISAVGGLSQVLGPSTAHPEGQARFNAAPSDQLPSAAWVGAPALDGTAITAKLNGVPSATAHWPATAWPSHGSSHAGRGPHPNAGATADHSNGTAPVSTSMQDARQTAPAVGHVWAEDEYWAPLSPLKVRPAPGSTGSTAGAGGGRAGGAERLALVAALSRICEVCRRTAAVADPADAVAMLRALARLSWRDDGLVALLTEQLLAHSQRLEPAQVVGMVWAYGKLGLRMPAARLHAMLDQVQPALKTARGLDASQLTALLWGLAAVRVPPRAHVARRWAAALAVRGGELSAGAVAAAAWALRRLQLPPYRVPGATSVLLTRASQLCAEMDAGQLLAVVLLWRVGRGSDAVPPAELSPVCDALITRLDELDCEQWASAPHGHSLALWALATLRRVPPAGAAAAAAAHVAAHVEQYSGHALAVMLSALALTRLRGVHVAVPEGLLLVVQGHVMQVLHTMAFGTVTRVLAGMLGSGLDPHPDLVAAAAAHLDPGLDRLDLASLARLAASLAALAPPLPLLPSGFVARLGHAVLARLEADSLALGRSSPGDGASRQGPRCGRAGRRLVLMSHTAEASALAGGGRGLHPFVSLACLGFQGDEDWSRRAAANLAHFSETMPLDMAAMSLWSLAHVALPALGPGVGPAARPMARRLAAGVAMGGTLDPHCVSCALWALPPLFQNDAEWARAIVLPGLMKHWRRNMRSWDPQLLLQLAASLARLGARTKPAWRAEFRRCCQAAEPRLLLEQRAELRQWAGMLEVHPWD